MWLKNLETVVWFVKDACARIARTFPNLTWNNYCLSKEVDTHDLISAWLLLWYVHHLGGIFIVICTNYQALDHKGLLHT